MNLHHFMRKEKSGLAFTTMELVDSEESMGHGVCVQEPSDPEGAIGPVLYGDGNLKFDIELIHSQLPTTSYHNNLPKVMWCHGEPLSSVGNGVSMKAILDMASRIDAFIAMRQDEWAIWNAIKRTYLVPKGVDLTRFKPIEVLPHDDANPESKLSGDPAILYVEHWRGQRNPLYLLAAMEKVWKRLPGARLHLFNCTDKKMYETFNALIKHNKYWPFVRTLSGPVADDKVNLLYNQADIVVSCLYPLYARSIEAFAAGKALVAPGYKEHDYPFQCDLSPDSIADAIIKAWDNRGMVDFRQWAEKYHDVDETVRQSLDIYRRYL